MCLEILLTASKYKELGEKLSKYIQDLFTENVKAFLKEIKDHVNKVSNISCVLIGIYNII